MEETLELDAFNDNLVLTTKDNPFNPKEMYKNWKTWDESHGYHTEAYLARVANIPLDVDINDDVLIEQFIKVARESILEHDSEGIYMLV